MSVNEEELLELFKGARELRRPLSVPLCVIDTNVLLDLLYFADSNCGNLKKSLDSRSIQAVGHYDTFYEFADVISREQFQLNDIEKDKLLQSWLNLHAILAEPLEKESFCKDPDDDKFFNLAKASGVSWLISKDKKVLKARGKAKRFGCALIKPENFPI